MLLALTGCSGTGASTVAGVWEGMGASVCSLDGTGHQFLDRKPVKQRLESELGIPGLSMATGGEIRGILREKVFTDPGTLKVVNSVLHPRLVRWTALSAGKLRNLPGVFVLDAALVFELGLEREADLTVTVRDTSARSRERLVKRDEISPETAEGRWRGQLDIMEKCRRSNFVLDNSGSLEDLYGIAAQFFTGVIKKMEDARWHTKQEKN